MSRDLPIDEIRTAFHQAADWAAGYLEEVGELPVLPSTRPGEVASLLAPSAPTQGESMEHILEDFRRVIVPHMTHWNHPGFYGYIAISASAPGIVGETLASTLNVNGMLWRTSPAFTELEERVCAWVAEMIGLPPVFRGHINDTASIGVFLALAAARQRAVPDVRLHGLAGRTDLARLVVYCSDQAHSSADKAVVALGLGLDSLRRLPSDDAFRLRPEVLAQAVERDLAAGLRPIALIATAGTTSTGSLDPLAELAAIARAHGLWVHVDAAYGGGAAVCPEVRARLGGLEEADSIVVNAHKWLFTPIDCSLLFLRDPEILREAFWVLPEYLRTPEVGVSNLMELGLQLGRRFRALKLWMVLRAFGVEGLRERIRHHLELARRFAAWVEAEPGFVLAAPVALGIVAFRAVGGGTGEADDAFNERLLAEVNAAGPVFLSHSKLAGRIVLRVAIGNIRTEEEHVAGAWRLLCETAARLRGEGER